MQISLISPVRLYSIHCVKLILQNLHLYACLLESPLTNISVCNNFFGKTLRLVIHTGYTNYFSNYCGLYKHTAPCVHNIHHPGFLKKQIYIYIYIYSPPWLDEKLFRIPSML